MNSMLEIAQCAGNLELNLSAITERRRKMKKNRNVFGVCIGLFILQACSHMSADQTKNSAMGESFDVAPKSDSMTKNTPAGIRNQQLPCRVNNHQKEGFSSQARHVEIGLSQDVPSAEGSSPTLYSRYQECDE